MRYKKLFVVGLWTLCYAGSGARARAQSTDTLTVHFAFNESILRPEDLASLDHWFNISPSRLQSIQLIGYCDSVGKNRYNDSLSLQRITEVQRYLATRGMPDSLFKVLRAYGKRRPLNDNADEEKRSLNRRVTIVRRLKPPETGLREALRDTAAVVGKNIVLYQLLFYRDTHHPLPAGIPVLQELSAIMHEHPGLKIEIQGYVCCMPEGMDGRDMETQKFDLSVQRAKYAYAYLVAHGIDTTRISYRGFGGNRKIYPLERNDFEMMQNRRVEIRILGW